MKRFANVLVDLDGTLTDPFEGIAGCIRHAMLSMELEPPQEDELRGAIGPPLRQSFARLLARHGAEGRVEEALRCLSRAVFYGRVAGEQGLPWSAGDAG